MTDVSNKTNTLADKPRPRAPQIPFTVRPGLRQYWGYTGFAAVSTALALSSFFYFKFNATVWLVTMMGLAAIILIYLFFMTRRSFTFNPDEVHYRGSSGRTFKFTYSEIELVKMFTEVRKGTPETAKEAILYPKGRRPIRVIGMFWKANDVQKIIDVLNYKKVPIDNIKGGIYPADVSKKQADLRSFPERHPAITFFILFVVIMAIAISVAMFLLGRW